MDEQSKTTTVEAIDSGLAPGTILKRCDDAQNGVSVKNVPEPTDSHMPEMKAGYYWYVFRASYGREERATKLLKEKLGAFTYTPKSTVYTRTKTGVKSMIQKLMPNFVFAYLTEYEARLYAKGPSAGDEAFKHSAWEKQKAVHELNELISFYYNHFQKDGDGMNPPLVIPYGQMATFVKATWPEKNVIPVTLGTFEIGEEVEVIEGEFKGLRGRVIRKQDKKQRLGVQLINGGMQAPPSSQKREKRRLLFQLSCLGSFGSAYIPVAYFRKVGL